MDVQGRIPERSSIPSIEKLLLFTTSHPETITD